MDTITLFSLPTPSSDTAEPTPAPSPFTIQSLRDSCHNCYKAKVKCSKTKPECERCINRGYRCVYLPSRRRGRTKAMSGRRTSQSSPTPSHRDSLDCSSQCGSIMLPDDLDLSKTLPHRSKYPASDFPALDTLNGSSSSPIDFFAVPESAPSLFSEPDISPSQDFFGTNFGMPGFPLSASANPGLFTPPASAQGTPEGRKQNMFSPESIMAHLSSLQCDCLSQCLEALNILYRPSASLDCTPSFDLIMTMNTWATSQCSSTLNCMKCFSQGGNSSLAMLLGTLLIKILAYYQAAVLGTSVQRDNNPTRSTLESSPVDAGAEQRLKLDILRPELQRLQPLLGRFNDLCDRVRDESSAELFQSLPKNLENGLLNLTLLFQQQSQQLTSQGIGARTVR